MLTVLKYIDIENIPDFKTIVGIYQDTDGRKFLGLTIFHLKYDGHKPYVIKFNVNWADDERIEWLSRVLVYDYIDVIRRSTITALSEVRNAYDNFLTKLK